MQPAFRLHVVATLALVSCGAPAPGVVGDDDPGHGDPGKGDGSNSGQPPSCGDGVLDHGEFCFDPGTSITGDPVGDRLEAGDFDGDGHRDIAAIYPGTRQLVILAGHGDGTFTVHQTDDAFDRAVSDLAVADLDGDGLDDLALAAYSPTCHAPGSQPYVLTYLSNGDGSFRAGGTSDLSSRMSMVSLVTAADVNGDGRPEILVAGGMYSAGQSTCIPHEALLESSLVLIHEEPGGAFLTMGNVDDRPELELLGREPPFLVVDYGYLSASQPHTALLTPSLEHFEVADIDHDGANDIVGTSDHWVAYFRNTGAPMWTFEQLRVVGSTRLGRFSFVRDLDHDDLPDLLVLSEQEGKVRILPGHAGAQFDAPLEVSTGGPADQRWSNNPPVVADFNEDGVPDLVFRRVIDGTSISAGLGIVLSNP